MIRPILGDSSEVLKTLADASVDSCVTDPPYDLKFMGKAWDTGDTAHDPAFWREVYRVLKPGAHVVAASGTRTYHRLACAVEDAGFEIRDMVSWLYGSGFPKSHDVSKGIDRAAGAARKKTGEVRRASIQRNGDPRGAFASHPEETKRVEITAAATPEALRWEGWGTALKPACEPWVLARKPLGGNTVAANVLAHGTGALNIDGCRVGLREKPKVTDPKRTSNTYGEIDSPGGKLLPDARWPANVCHDGSDEVLAAFPDAPGQSGAVTGLEPSTTTRNTFGLYNERATAEPRGDTGSAARFFYTAKADAEDRLGSKHPTVKPISLMRWLCRLVTPPGGLILDPFAGTGTTGIAADAEGFDCVLIERDPVYFAGIEERIAWARGEATRTTGQIIAERKEQKLGGLFEGVE